MIRIISSKSLVYQTFQKVNIINNSKRLLFVSRYHASKDQRFLRFIDFDAKYLDQMPFFFKPLEPGVNFIKDYIIQFNNLAGLPWWIVLFISALAVRIIIFPLILIQMKKMSKMGPVAPIFVHIKDTWKDSQMPFKTKVSTIWKVYKSISKQQGFKFSTMFVYNLAYYPFLITMIYSIRKVIASPQFSGTSFLHIQNFTDIDPYFILPTLTIGLYYWNFQRFITPENKNTLITKIRVACQIFLIMWYPFLCCWPSGLVLYMCANAIISVIQTSLMKSPWFLSKLSQKTTFYGLILSKAEYDKGTSQSVISAIKSGQQLSTERGIKQQVLLKQIENMLKNLQQQKKQSKQDDQLIERQLNKPQKEGSQKTLQSKQQHQQQQSKQQKKDLNVQDLKKTKPFLNKAKKTYKNKN